jgi:hypothetical protein
LLPQGPDRDRFCFPTCAFIGGGIRFTLEDLERGDVEIISCDVRPDGTMTTQIVDAAMDSAKEIDLGGLLPGKESASLAGPPSTTVRCGWNVNLTDDSYGRGT